MRTGRLREKENLSSGIVCRALHNEDAISFLAACCNKKKRDLKMGLSVWESLEPRGSRLRVCPPATRRVCPEGHRLGANGTITAAAGPGMSRFTGQVAPIRLILV